MSMPPASPRDTHVAKTLRLALVDMTNNAETRGAVKANTCKGGKSGIRGTDKEGFSPQITEKLPTDPNTLKPNPMATDITSIQVCQPHDSPHRHFMVSDIPTGDLFIVSIAYGMDKHENKGGHMTEALLPENPRPPAWGKRPISNFSQTITTWKKTT